MYVSPTVSRKVGFPKAKGFSSLCIATLSSIISTNVERDPRFNQKLDDPKMGRGDERAKQVMAIPLMARECELQDDMVLPAGAVVAINKRSGSEFSTSDMRNLSLYGSLVVKSLVVISYGNSAIFTPDRKLEYFLSTKNPVERIDSKAKVLINSMDITSDCIDELKKGFTEIRSMVARPGRIVMCHSEIVP